MAAAANRRNPQKRLGAGYIGRAKDELVL